MKRCVVIGSMPIDIPLKDYIKPADFIFCADGGYISAEKMNIEPNMIVGDFDSAPKPQNTAAFILTLPHEKDDTDTYHIAKIIVENGYTDALFCGVTGGRADHTFANLQMLKYLAKNNVNATIIDKNSQYIAVKDGSITIPNVNKSYLSVFALDTACYGVNITGAHYRVENQTLTNDFPVGVSNEFSGKPVNISVEKGCLLIIITKKGENDI